MDFTIKQYKQLLQALQEQGFSFQTYAQFAEDKSNSSAVLGEVELGLSGVEEQKLIILRHDVDKLPKHSLRFAKIQAEMGIKGTYYFRMVPQSYDERIIKEIAALGHEVGYHYETMDTCRGDIDKAYEEFCRNLERFREIVEIKTISMHGSPLSSFDNRAIWEKYSYKELGIIAEPYFDLNFNKTFYITDTGRRWDGHLFNVRDKATKDNPVTNEAFLKLRFHSTQDIIDALTGTELVEVPNQIMLNFHPQRWNDAFLPWLKELLWQNVKNQVKRILVIKSNLT